MLSNSKSLTNTTMLNTKPADAAHYINELIKNRYSALGIDPNQPVEKEKFESMLEAARWAPSSYNEQPWSYVVGFKGDENHQKLASCLVEGNSWARQAPILMLSVAKKKFTFNNSENRHHMHDVGAANAIMHLQATDLGLAMHQMAGFNVEKARQIFNIGEEYEPASMIAVGYLLQDKSILPESLQKREASKRTRKEFEKMFWEF